MLPHTFQPFFSVEKVGRLTDRQMQTKGNQKSSVKLSSQMNYKYIYTDIVLYFSEKTWCIVILYSFTTHDPIVCWCLDTDLLCHLYNDLTGPRVKLRLGVWALFLYCVHNISVGHWLPLIKSVNLQNQVKTKTSKLSSL